VQFLATLLGISLSLLAEDFFEARMRSGEELLRQGRSAEAAAELKIASFGLLDRPALLCEALAARTAAQSAAGQRDEAAATLDRWLQVRRSYPACRDARIDSAWAAAIQEVAKRRLSESAVRDLLASSPRGGSPQPTAVTNAASTPAAPASAPPTPAPASPSPAVSPPPTPTATALPPPPPTRPPTAVPPPAPTAAPSPRPTAIPSRRPTRAPAAPPSVARPPATRPPATSAPPPPATSAAYVSTPAPVPSEDLDRQPQIRYTTPPVYPESALRSRTGGIVLLRVLVAENGMPLEVVVARGVRRDLDEAALAAVRRWVFEPGRRNGSAVRAWMTVAVPFDLPRR
jgi:periplasmic protein TonB